MRLPAVFPPLSCCSMCVHKDPRWRSVLRCLICSRQSKEARFAVLKVSLGGLLYAFLSEMLVSVLWATLASALATDITSPAITSSSANISASTTSAQLSSTLGSSTASQITRSGCGSLSSITTISTTLSSQSTSAVSSSITILPTSSVNGTSNYSLSGVASTSTGSASRPSQSLDPGTLTDIETIRERRLSIILEGVDPTSVANISAWSVSILFTLCGASDFYGRLSTLGEDGKWPDSEVDYTTGCDARRANWYESFSLTWMFVESDTLLSSGPQKHIGIASVCISTWNALRL